MFRPALCPLPVLLPPAPPLPLPAPLHPFAIICPTYLPVLAIELETARKSEKFHQNFFEKKYSKVGGVVMEGGGGATTLCMC